MSFGRPGGFGRDFFGDRPKPVKVGEELDVTIEAVASKGDGIAKREGFVIFVPGTAAGDKVRIKVTYVKSRCAVAEKIGPASGEPETSSESAEAPSEEDAAEEEGDEPEEPSEETPDESDEPSEESEDEEQAEAPEDEEPAEEEKE